MHGRRNGGKVCCDVMLVAILANEMQQLLHGWNFHHSGATKRFKRIVGESPAAYVAAHAARGIIRGKARERHLPGFDLPDYRAESVFHAHGSGNDCLIVHFCALEEMLRQVAAMEADGFVWIFSVVVIPIEQRAGRLRGEAKHMHAEHTANIHFACAGH